jgi:hypothetical protein
LATPGTRYSFTGALTRPRQLLPGGYISFVNEAADEWQQILWVDTSQPPQERTLGPATGKSLREWIDGDMSKGNTGKLRHQAVRSVAAERLEHARKRRAALEEIAAMRAKHYK